MAAPSNPVTLTPEQIAEISRKLGDLRHNVNNQLSRIVAATELIRRRPESLERYSTSLSEPPQKITDELKSFSQEFEQLLQITRP
jgi:hypothetical protein